jgi:hypothetical protein
MAYEIPGFKLGTEKAAADLSAKQYYALVPTATGLDVAGAGVKIAGVNQGQPALGETVEMTCDGVSKCVAGAAVAKGAEVEVDANGKFITLAAGISVGFALEAAGGADELFAVLLK